MPAQTAENYKQETIITGSTQNQAEPLERNTFNNIEKTMYQKMMQKFEEDEELGLILCNFKNISETGEYIGQSREIEGKYTRNQRNNSSI